jgi:hypothetical protein
LSKTGVVFNSFAISVFVLGSVQVYSAVLLIYLFHLCCCFSSCISCFNRPIFTAV